MLVHEVRSQELIEKLERQMQDLVKAGKHQEAFEVWLAFPESWRSRELDREIIAIIQRTLPAGFRPRPPMSNQTPARK